jgi:hypothetical protein
MPRKPSEPPKVFEATVFVIGKKLPSGNTYPQELADRIIMNVVTGKEKYTIEEVAPADRAKNGIQPYESWKQRAMAVCVDAHMDGCRLVMTFKIYKNKYGKSLELILQNNPPGSIEFYPVGIGNPDENGVVTDYELAYVTMDVKQRGIQG